MFLGWHERMMPREKRGSRCYPDVYPISHAHKGSGFRGSGWEYKYLQGFLHIYGALLFRWGATPLTLQLNGSVAVHTSKLREFKLISSTPIKNWFSQQDQGTRPHNFVVQPACQKNKSLDNTSCITLMWQLLLGQLIQSIGHDYGKGCGKSEQRLWDVTELQQQNWKVPISPFLTFSQRQSIPI